LRLASREEAERPHKPVNILFRSLSEEHGHRTVAVALSGTDADGAEGLDEVTAADSAYADLLQHEPAEINALAQDFLIRVTGFFRDPSTASIVKAASRQAPI
jgi:chemotaxis methyl-accepting protein methylase